MSRRWRLHVWSVLLAISLAACGGVVRMTAYRPAMVATEQSGVDLYHAAIRVLVRNGFGFTSRDDGALAIETDYRTVTESTGPGGRSYRYSWRIFTVGGDLSIFASCFSLVVGPGAAEHECPPDARPPAIGAEQERLAREIVADAVASRGQVAAALHDVEREGHADGESGRAPETVDGDVEHEGETVTAPSDADHPPRRTARRRRPQTSCNTACPRAQRDEHGCCP